MALTPETLPRHELNGLWVVVVDAPNPDLVGIAGRVVVETTNTLYVDPAADGDGSDGGDARVRQVPKRGSTFQFRLTDESADSAKESGTASEPDHPTGDDAAYVTVDGARLLSRPALRTETTGDSKWR
ncbi:ribonuclease P protein component 1 [Haloarchaeobius sp. HRN-SO-5]|uniref:ribonuclease P protein component 1 n=1 Tax=Haloarchaeobius sp. HRN-SO-5 TaxID=3446118 RepID=UPI003EBBBFA6